MISKGKVVSILALAAVVFGSFATAQTVKVPQGTSIRLRLSQNVSSANARAGDVITLEVLDDVRVGDFVSDNSARRPSPREGNRGAFEAAHGARWGGRDCHRIRRGSRRDTRSGFRRPKIEGR